MTTPQLGNAGDTLTLHIDASLGAVAWSPDSRLLASGTKGGGCGDGPFGGGCWYSGQLRLWDTETGNIALEIPYPNGGITSLAWSTDGAMLAVGLAAWEGVTGIDDHRIAILDTATGEEVQEFSGHSGNVVGLAFSPDGESLASVSSDGTIIVWAVEN